MAAFGVGIFSLPRGKLYKDLRCLGFSSVKVIMSMPKYLVTCYLLHIHLYQKSASKGWVQMNMPFYLTL
uniref:Uncharacterized protein n=1 Tax=Rhizophora mucronata TaxID=61149 RepID=A0A2P2PRP6_RHIMU